MNIAGKDKREKDFREEVMKRITKALQEAKLVVLNTKLIDGRHDSTESEEYVRKAIIKHVESDPFFKKHKLIAIEANVNGNNRDWYDILIRSHPDSKNNYFIPINIKIPALSNRSSDNSNCKLAILYTYTGCIPEDIIVNGRKLNNNASWKTVFSLMRQYMATNKNKDFFFLVLNKDDPTDVFYTSIRTLKSITANGSNLPFQCNWNENRERVERTYEESRRFILSNFRESLRKREKVSDLFDEYLGEYIEDSDSSNAELNEEDIKLINEVIDSCDQELQKNENNIIVKTYERKWDAIWDLMFLRSGKSSPLQISFHQ